MTESSYQLLLEKLNEFIRKYYINQTIRGLILFFSLGIVLFLSLVLIEYFGEFNSTIRTALFYGSSSFLLIVFSVLIAKPLLRILAIGKRISHETASRIIGQHFEEINDKLFNVLQLNNQKESGSTDLIIASINQKINELKPVPFGLAINFRENRRYLKYLIVPSITILLLAAFEPKIIQDSANRLVAHQTNFIPLAPYQITIKNESLTAYKNEDFTLNVQLNGNEIPNNLNVIFSGKRFLMSKEGKNSFQYSFKNIQKNIDFTLFDGEFESENYHLETLPRPLLLNFSIELNYPEYLNKMNTRIENTGDIIIPEGTQAKWLFNTENTNEFVFITRDSPCTLR